VPTNYTGNATNTQAPSPQPGPATVVIIATPNDAEAANAASLLQPWKALADDLAWIKTIGLAQVGGLPYGDGSNGTQTLPGGDTVLTLNPGVSMNYQNLTLGATSRLYTQGNIIRVKDTLTIASGGFIQPFASANLIGSNGAGGAGGAGGTNMGLSGGVYLGTKGGAGGNAVANGVAGEGADVIGGGYGGVGSGVLTAFTPGAGGAAPIQELDARRYAYGTPGISPQGLAMRYLVGGTGGGGGAGSTGVGGGGGGAGGAGLWIFARRVVVATATDFRSPGGAGGNGNGIAGGGGGGGGGYIVVVTGSFTGPAITAAAVLGGAAGSGGTGTAAPGGVGNWTTMILG
jgi:hypothetical protein